ncbi:MAG: DUF2764 family protein [Bacteroidales bacterium]|nr:DUF2764 family protein [Bacteroidales bacterium]
MNNYIYIISSLPALSKDWKGSDGFSAQDIIAEIKARLSAKDNEKIDFFLQGFQDDSLNKEYYEKAAESNSQFVKDYYKFDMNVRNVKARYLNAAFDRPADQDVIVLEGQDPAFEEEGKVKAVLENKDILAREKGLDDIMWNKIYELTLFHYLDMDVIYSFLAKLHIIDRWLKLDEQTGREMFRKLVGEVRGTFKGVEYSE